MNDLIRHIIIACVTLSVLVSCIDPFEPDINQYENIYVVDGELTNFPGPYTVKLTKSKEVGGEQTRKVSGAEVSIIDRQQNRVFLEEIDSGVYRTVDEDFRGIPGHFYKLRIVINENNVLESDFEELKAPVAIDSIYWEFHNGSVYGGQDGLNVYLDSRPTTDNSIYYAWEYEEYWKFESRYAHVDFTDRIECWDSSMVHPIIVGTMEGLKENVITRKDLYFIGNRSRRLSFRYSTLVKQYAISETVYKFYKDLQTLVDRSGGLYDPIPFSLKGNMHHINQPEVPVLGIFQVAGISQKRIYINGNELPKELVVYDGFNYCEKINLSGDDLQMLPTYLENGYVEFYNGIEGVVLVPDSACFICTKNGTNQKPEFWED